ncbi:MAG: NAD(P)/FAD-dependent oxidoreductase [Myxococcota bacterium]|nr:NAD(P)/FAD-dependent oxidoreductase [Myxococcota bacterium]
MGNAPAQTGPQIAIIGAGFSGICLGIQLRQAGIRSFTIYEKADGLGGTWRDNRYPGAECDIQAFQYCFSFEQKTDWSAKWVGWAEILDYMEHCARKYELGPHLRFRTEIESARWNEPESIWEIRSTAGEEIQAEILVSGVGQLNRPKIPEVPGLGSFAGDSFHSARWNADCDITEKNVGVIGNAASAIQFIPEIAKQVKSLTVFQRSANWMLPRGNRAFTEKEKQRFTRFPILARTYRSLLWALQESQFPAFIGNSWLSRRMERFATRKMREQIRDPELARALVPDYPIGARRILISDDYYPTLLRENVEVVLEPIDRVTPEGIVTRDGQTRRFDAIILATGFETTAFLSPMKIEGRDGKSLTETWKAGAEAYLGISVAGFPNFFLMYGPNTNLGHNSIIFMIECQTRYILDCLRQLRERKLRSIDVRGSVMEAFNRRVLVELGQSVWAATDHSWYKQADGRITNNWSGSTLRYWWNTRHADLMLYDRRSSPGQSDP